MLQVVFPAPTIPRFLQVRPGQGDPKLDRIALGGEPLEGTGFGAGGGFGIAVPSCEEFDLGRQEMKREIGLVDGEALGQGATGRR